MRRPIPLPSGRRPAAPTPAGSPATARFSRRAFLAGSAALAVGAACGDDSSTTATGGTSTTVAGSYALGVFFPPSGVLHTGAPQRLPFGLFVDGAPATFEQAPESLEIRFVQDEADAGDAEPVVAVQRGKDDGLPRPFYVATHEFPATGTWYAISEVAGQPVQAAVGISEPSDVTVVRAGQKMPLVETPTVDDARGVNPICTREPACPLHEVSLAGALDENAPVAFLVSTPALCQTAVCGPVLDLLVAEAGQRDGIRFLHAEVYTDPTADPLQPAPVMAECGLTYEPALFLIGADGVVAERLDVTYDASELSDALDRLVAG